MLSFNASLIIVAPWSPKLLFNHLFIFFCSFIYFLVYFFSPPTSSSVNEPLLFNNSLTNFTPSLPILFPIHYHSSFILSSLALYLSLYLSLPKLNVSNRQLLFNASFIILIPLSPIPLSERSLLFFSE